MQKPSFWRVFFAYGIDFVLLQFINMFFVLLASLSQAKYPAHAICGRGGCFEQPGKEPLFQWLYEIINSIGHWQTLLLFVFLASCIYFIVCEIASGKTVGKKIFRLKTVSSKPVQLLSVHILLAYFIDFVLIVPIIYAMTLCFVAWMDYAITNATILVFLALVFNPPVWQILYFAWCDRRWGKTLGKKICSLQVVQEETK